jgi:Tc5 transposase DNA-binding domain
MDRVSTRVFHIPPPQPFHSQLILYQPRRPTTFGMPQALNSSIELALTDLRNNPEASVRSVARAWNIPHNTLLRRLHGGKDRSHSHDSQMILTPNQEDLLVNWILEQERLGHAPTALRVRELAAEIGHNSGTKPIISEKWMTRFKQRHPEIQTKIGRAINSTRVHQTQPEILQPWFKRFQQLLTDYKVDVANLWNMDESGLGIGCTTNHRVIGSSSSTRSYVQSPETREWVTIIETVSARG